MKFKSYSWVVGTTSFRVKEVNYKIEQQLIILKELFRKFPDKKWQDLQEFYYDELHSKGLLVGNAKLKDKDAREKTSVLKELGLVTDNRLITEVGDELLYVINKGNIHSNNDFMIEDDAFIYLKQLLKVYVRDSDFNIRPFVALLYLLDKLGHLTHEEFTFLLPLCKNSYEVRIMVKYIKRYRDKKMTINQIIFLFMKKMSNYRLAHKHFLEAEQVNEELICQIGMNRKSRKYDKVYYPLYKAIWEALIVEKVTLIEFNNVKKALKEIKKPSSWWKKHLLGKNQKDQFNFFAKRIVMMKQFFRLSKGNYSKIDIDAYYDKKIPEKNFRSWFFKTMHLYKWRVNLEEYSDLNQRFFSLADIIIFQDGKVELSLFPKYFFHLCIDELLDEKIDNTLLNRSLSLEEISSALKIDSQDVVALVNQKTGKKLNVPSMKNYFKEVKEEQLTLLIKEKFPKEKIIELYTLMENRNDKNDEKIQEYVTDNADLPTIFEYLLGISWFYISEETINLNESWNLSLNANMLPKRHATGGASDIVIDYKAEDFYPEHKLMLEATLTNSTNQRRNEMEPVSRHLGNLKAQNPDKEVYCIFASNYLDPNVVIDFRSRKCVPFYDKNTDSFIKDNMIIPLSTKNLKMILNSNISYKELYKFFKKSYNSDINIQDWYEEEINKPLSSFV